MKKIRRSVAVAVALLAVFVGQASAGQKPAPPRAGEEVIVTQSGSGEELRGRLVELSPTSMSMLVNGQRVDVPIENVLRIDTRNDSLKNGTIIGAAIMGGLTGLMCVEFADAPACITGLVFNTGIGALAGAGIDALHKGRTPIYIKAGKSEAGLQVRLRF
jgi:hypothetical protein